MPWVESTEPSQGREDRTPVRFVWTTAGRVRRMTLPEEGKPLRPASRILDSLARFDPAPRPVALIFK
jgi:hypothetical protein